MSKRTRSGWCSVARAMPSAAVIASSVRKPWNWRRSRVSLRFLSLSSTTRMSLSPRPTVSLYRRTAAAPNHVHECLSGEASLFGEKGDARVEPLLVRGGDRLTRQDLHWDLPRRRMRPQALDDLETVGAGHQEVTDHETGQFPYGDLDSLVAAR